MARLICKTFESRAPQAVRDVSGGILTSLFARAASLEPSGARTVWALIDFGTRIYQYLPRGLLKTERDACTRRFL